MHLWNVLWITGKLGEMHLCIFALLRKTHIRQVYYVSLSFQKKKYIYIYS